MMSASMEMESDSSSSSDEEEAAPVKRHKGLFWLLSLHWQDWIGAKFLFLYPLLLMTEHCTLCFVSLVISRALFAFERQHRLQQKKP